MLRKYRFTTAAAIAVALGAASPAAAQQQDLRAPDTQDAANAVQCTSGSGACTREEGARAPKQDLRAPDNRFGQPTGEMVVPVPMPARVRIVEVPSSGLQWGDAAIGAAGMLGFIGLVGGVGVGLVGAQRRRSRVAATR
jgi:hypothetical protein